MICIWRASSSFKFRRIFLLLLINLPSTIFSKWWTYFIKRDIFYAIWRCRENIWVSSRATITHTHTDPHTHSQRDTHTQTLTHTHGETLTHTHSHTHTLTYSHRVKTKTNHLEPVNSYSHRREKGWREICWKAKNTYFYKTKSIIHIFLGNLFSLIMSLFLCPWNLYRKLHYLELCEGQITRKNLSHIFSWRF